MRVFRTRMGLVLVVSTLLGVWQLTSWAQPTEKKDDLQPAAAGARFNFDVLECFDAKYVGDTPGHIGRSGGLGTTRPNVALGDPVLRDEQKIGTITSVVWDRVKGSLTIEFDPEPGTRIAVGDAVWIALSPAPAPRKKS